MLKGSYGKEPFDLRLTMLRLVRNLLGILLWTLAGTILFGGLYYVKNIVCRPEDRYMATSTYKVQYVIDPNDAGAYYINETSWNTFVHTEEFLNAVMLHLDETIAQVKTSEQSEVAVSVAVLELEQMTAEDISATLSAKLPSDLRVPTTSVTTDSPAKSTLLAAAVEQAMMNEFVAGAEQEITAIRVIDSAKDASLVEVDVRPVRAFVLAAVLSGLFVVATFLLKELSDDSVWLPATLRRRYDLKTLGTVNSPDFRVHLEYLFGQRSKVAVCCVGADADTLQVVDKLGKELPVEWWSMPDVILTPESCSKLREADGVLLVVPAGPHSGKQVEYALDMLTQQECQVTAALLWEADELLIRMYYGFGKEEV